MTLALTAKNGKVDQLLDKLLKEGKAPASRLGSERFNLDSLDINLDRAVIAAVNAHSAKRLV